jgi:hypothetical protein
MCGKYSAELDVVAVSLTGGTVVIRKSLRSLYRPRKATTDIDAELETRNTP